MSARISGHIRSNLIGYVALFVALSGTAYAIDGPLPGEDQVGSADIINNEVQSADIKDANLTTADIRAEAVTQGKLGDDANAARAYAYVFGNATLDPTRSTDGISVSRNSFDNPGVYCFNLGFTPKSVSATAESFTSSDVVIVEAYVGETFFCPGAEAMATTHAAPGFGTKDEPFYIQFFD